MSPETNEIFAWFITAVIGIWFIRIMYDPRNKK